MSISYGAIYLLDEEDKFVFKASRSFKGVNPLVLELGPDDDFIKFIKFWRKGFMYEDPQKLMTQKINNKENPKKQCNADLSKVLTQMEQLKAKLVIPHFIKDELIGFLVLGEKVPSRPYFDADIEVLTTLSRSVGLAITNAISMIKLRDREREFADAARIIEIGNYASGTEHQLGNVLNAIIWGLFGVKNNKIITDLLQHNLEALSAFNKSLDDIITDAKDGGAIVKEIRDYSQQGASKKHTLTNLKEVLDKALRILLIQINKFQNIDIPIDIAADVPAVLGSPVGLQQVFINMFNNCYDSIQEMKGYINSHPELGIIDYKGRIEVRIRRVKGKVEIHIIDNGKGMTEEVARKLFGAHFTTKGSHEKRKEMNLNGGTGIGLFIMRRIIFDHGGTIALFRSEPLKGADFIIQLPVPKQ
jgi:signal transduction histidine kinase